MKRELFKNPLLRSATPANGMDEKEIRIFLSILLGSYSRLGRKSRPSLAMPRYK